MDAWIAGFQVKVWIYSKFGFRSKFKLQDFFRHSKASHLLASGVPIVYIRDFLGHADLETTMIYAKVDTELKSKAINALAPKIVGEGIQADWNTDGDLMDFLSSV